MRRSRIAFFVVILLFFGGLALTTWAADNQYLPLALFLVCASIAPFFLRFERRSIQARELVLLAVLSALAAVGRVPFAALPSVQPTSFIIIVSALVFGSETGFMVGAVAALVSNMFLGQGPWTPWQMFSWGMIGWTAGTLYRWGWLKHRLLLLAFGFVWGILFGWIMNIWFLANMGQDLTWPSILAAYAASFYFDLAHALCNVLFLALLGPGWIKILERYKRKYGLLELSSDKRV
ncbi:energy-coupling factor transport system substrate-specific component [Paenibacillus mucilaginosus]|uniref:ECF transporter S component n=1 Tax=Paenibacillus mucilaginosus TaxID=61624 RepID=UPI003D190E54